MKFLKAFLTVIGGGSVLVVIGLVATPKSAHALVAALVEVVNTAAAPAVTQDVGKLAGQAVQVWCPFSFVGCFAPYPSVSAPTYTVPVGQSLMVTSVDFVWKGGPGSPASNSYTLYCGPTLSLAAEVGEWFLPGDTSPSQFIYPSGYKIPGGCAVSIATSSTNNYDVIVRGYLSTN
jgi:hypothetical protein